MNYNPEHYYLYEEMIELMHCWQANFPNLIDVSSIGRSFQGREIPLVTLTAGDGKKPAILISGNIHSAEVMGSCAVLYTIDKILRGYGTEPDVTEILDDKVLYCIPRINVDAVDANLTTDEFYRGSCLPFHKDEDGIVRCDVDGDGVVRQMRRRNPEGPFYASAMDNNILFHIWPGMPIPEGVERYDLVSEGMYRGAGEPEFRERRNPCDIDPNRSFPFEWNREAIGITLRPSAGDYPLMDCETRALAQFVLAHPEIVMALDFHSNMGAYITPMEFCKHLESDEIDSETFYTLGDELHQICGYQVRDIFPAEAVRPAPGSYTTWLYYTLGIPAWCAEIGGLKRLYTSKEQEETMMYMTELSEEPAIVENFRKLVEWDQKWYGGRYFMPWHEFDHPQFGRIEIGGWRDTNDTNTIWNFPEEYLPEECEYAYQFNIANIRAAAQLKIRSFEVTGVPTEGNAAAIAVIGNTGRFASTKSMQGHMNGMSSPGMAEVYGILDGKQKLLIRELLPVIAGNTTVELSWNLPNEEYDEYLLIIEGDCAGEQMMRAKREV